MPRIDIEAAPPREGSGRPPIDAAAWKAGVPVGDHLANRSEAPATLLVTGARASADMAHRTDPDAGAIARVEKGRAAFTRSDSADLGAAR